MERLAVIVTVADVLCAGGVIVHLVMQRKEPIAKAFWIFYVITVPFIGLLSYLLFGIIINNRRMKKRIKRRFAVRQKFDADAGISKFQADFTADERYRSVVRCHRLFARLNQRPTVEGNAVELLIAGQEAYPRLFKDIAEAQSSVHIQSYILADDEFGWELGGLLAARAKEGIEVRVLFDAVGSMHLSDTLLHFLRGEGVQIEPFGQLNPIKRGFQFNLRNHRKNAVIDGRIGYTGGLNLHAENSTRYCRQPRGCPTTLVHDYHFRILGPVVTQLQEVFAEDWFVMTEEMLVEDKYFPRAEAHGPVLARVIASGPDEQDQVMSRAYFGAITSAREEILMVTPYFYPDLAILEAIKTAALAGVAVHLILPVRSDHRVTSRAAYSLFPELHAAGVHVYRRPLPFIHGKAIIIDRSWAMVGSANLDYRSLRLNFELNLVLSGDEIIGRLTGELLAEIGKSQRVSTALLRQWGYVHQFKNNLCALFAPLL